MPVFWKYSWSNQVSQKQTSGIFEAIIFFGLDAFQLSNQWRQTSEGKNTHRHQQIKVQWL